VTDPTDPVLVRRALIARWVAIGQRVGYGLFGIAIVAFVIGFIVGFDSAHVNVIVPCLVIGSLILAPAIVFGYGVKAAERDERGQGRSTH
jgi:hypothetical protein